jgi:hypothetical protein
MKIDVTIVACLSFYILKTLKMPFLYMCRKPRALMKEGDEAYRKFQRCERCVQSKCKQEGS